MVINTTECGGIVHIRSWLDRDIGKGVTASSFRWRRGLPFGSEWVRRIPSVLVALKLDNLALQGTDRSQEPLAMTRYMVFLSLLRVAKTGVKGPPNSPLFMVGSSPGPG